MTHHVKVLLNQDGDFLGCVDEEGNELVSSLQICIRKLPRTPVNQQELQTKQTNKLLQAPLDAWRAQPSWKCDMLEKHGHLVRSTMLLHPWSTDHWPPPYAELKLAHAQIRVEEILRHMQTHFFVAHACLVLTGPPSQMTFRFPRATATQACERAPLFLTKPEDRELLRKYACDENDPILRTRTTQTRSVVIDDDACVSAGLFRASQEEYAVHVRYELPAISREQVCVLLVEKKVTAEEVVDHALVQNARDYTIREAHRLLQGILKDLNANASERTSQPMCVLENVFHKVNTNVSYLRRCAYHAPDEQFALQFVDETRHLNPALCVWTPTSSSISSSPESEPKKILFPVSFRCDVSAKDRHALREALTPIPSRMSFYRPVHYEATSAACQ